MGRRKPFGWRSSVGADTKKGLERINIFGVELGREIGSSLKKFYYPPWGSGEAVLKVM